MNDIDQEVLRLANRYFNSDSYKNLKSESHISFKLHRVIKHKDLDQYMLGKTKIYMDLNFWINLRNSIWKKSEDKRYFQLLEILKEKVKDKRIVCPFSNVLIEEVFKQDSKDSRLKTFQIADILADKIMLSPVYYISMCEVHNLNSIYLGKQPTNLWYKWRRPINALGDFSLKTKEELSEDELLIKKAMYDINLQSSFQYVLGELDAASFINKESSVWHANMVNQSKAFSDPSGLSKKKLHRLEIRSSYKTIAKHIQSSVEVDVDSIIDHFSLSRLKEITPTCYAYSALYTELILDRTRKIKPNDYYDIMHSSLALSTCDIFLTEKSFASTLKRMKIDKEFDVRVLFDIDEIIEIVESL